MNPTGNGLSALHIYLRVSSVGKIYIFGNLEVYLWSLYLKDKTMLGSSKFSKINNCRTISIIGRDLSDSLI